MHSSPYVFLHCSVCIVLLSTPIFRFNVTTTSTLTTVTPLCDPCTEQLFYTASRRGRAFISLQFRFRRLHGIVEPVWKRQARRRVQRRCIDWFDINSQTTVQRRKLVKWRTRGLERERGKDREAMHSPNYTYTLGVSVEKKCKANAKNGWEMDNEWGFPFWVLRFVVKYGFTFFKLFSQILFLSDSWWNFVDCKEARV